MDKAKQLQSFVLSRVGCAYIYGCTGRDCTVQERVARAGQYPAFAGRIRENCPRLLSGKKTCDGCKWYGDGEARPAYDCAQLTRRAAESVGLKLPSGASSQWNQKGADEGKHSGWAETGVIAAMPRDKVCAVYRRTDSGNPMGHAGWYLGDGTCVDARGHAQGVVKSLLSEYPWTHYAVLAGLYGGEAPEPGDALARVREAYGALGLALEALRKAG